ncbi:MAG: radical SAM protein [Desulfamplus sp.]|nr:radical SAM protein [Desulfamplus sp.]MBF0258766.1 radical SAM protein [Desulfamplus sp.]
MNKENKVVTGKSADKKIESYSGFELGPIRPPSEAASLLIRVTRNCPWNHCRFCGIYRKQKFSLRPLSHVLKDIDLVRKYVEEIKSSSGKRLSSQSFDENEQSAFYSALNWVRNGMESIFLQDSNSLIIKPDHLVEILLYIRAAFPEVKRITSYARSHTIARIKDNDLDRIAMAGLNRIHIGMESASDKVLDFMKKGVDKATHIRAGQKVKSAGIELSEYYMPGLGGREMSRDHALESADALNQINADFVRLRTLAIPPSTALFKDWNEGKFQKMGDRETAEETLLFLENLQGITTTIKSDHILNLFEEIDGKLPEDKLKMTGVIRTFLNMDPKEQVLYQVGRRTGLFSRISDMNDPGRRAIAQRHCSDFNVNPGNVDIVINEIMKRFV